MTRTGLSVTFTSSRQNILQAGARAAILAQALLGLEAWEEGRKKQREFCSHEPPIFEPSIHYQPAEARSEGWRQNTRPADGSTGAKIKFQTNFYFKMKFWILSKSRNNSWFARLLFFKNNELIYYYRKTFKKQVLFFVPSEAWRCCNSWFCFFRVRRELAPNLVKITKYKLKLFYLV